jgi:hypothetical protein
MNIDHGARNSIYRTGYATRGFASLALPYSDVVLGDNSWDFPSPAPPMYLFTRLFFTTSLFEAALLPL